jgi:hypothetical protein
MMIAELVRTFDTTLKFMELSVADLSDEQMVEQPVGVPNHGMWTLGHMTFSCQGVAVELGVPPWLPDHWETTFGYGSTPSSTRSGYPSKGEMLAYLADAKHRLRQTLVAADERVLNQSLADPTFPTMRHLLMQVVGAHSAYHAGQLSVWRRAIGKESAGVFI